MNVNPLLQGLTEVTGLPVEPDLYEGEEDKYIVYTYQDERPVQWGDNRPLDDTAWIDVALYTPKRFNYMRLKHQVRDYLENKGFIVSDIRSWLDPDGNGDYVRHTTFNAQYTARH